MNLVECPKCEALTVQANFCRGCGESIKTAKIVEAPQAIKDGLGVGFYRGPRSNWIDKIWK